MKHILNICNFQFNFINYHMARTFFIPLLLLIVSQPIQAQQKEPFKYMDVFELEWASDPEISPDASQVVYRRSGFDVMNDRSRGNLWMVDIDGSNHRKLTSRDVNESQAIWSPQGDRIAFVSSSEEGAEIYMYWTATGQIARLSQLESSPRSLTWSPNGRFLAFTMFKKEKPPVVVQLPSKPEGAKWAAPARITDRLKHEADGSGYMEPGFDQIFIVSSEGGTARQLTDGPFNHNGDISFSPDGSSIYFSANRNDDWEYQFSNSEIYKLDVLSRTIEQLTNQDGPDRSPVISPDGKRIAFLSYPDKQQSYQISQLYLMNSDGSNRQILSENLDRGISNIKWDTDGKGLYFSYDDKGDTKIAHIKLNGKITTLAEHMGGTTIGRPYASGSYSVSKNGTLVYSMTTPYHPAELAVIKEGNSKLITSLNSDILDYKDLGKVEEVWYTSTFDARDLQGWIVKPPGYDGSKTYPLIVENHGGPHLNYGNRFSSEMQLMAADGYIVFYPNARGSTGYGEEFANLLYNNYPGEDYNDTMDGVDYLIEKGLVDEEKLFVTGGSAGGIMSAWIIGKTDRFKAAVVQKPVMNWISKTLVADNYYGYANSRYPGQPWENFETYWKFSPISLVGNVQTPTMVMVGLNDLRTPPSEAKQLYHALKLRKIETVLVELPDASHGIASKPSNLISKIAHTLAWFKKYRD